MTHYEQRLDKDLNRLRGRVDTVAAQVEKALKDAVHALLTGNDKLAYATILGDGPINRTVRDIDKLCHGFIALHLPSAGHLRLISSIIRAAIHLERIGDYAVTICRESVQLSVRPDRSAAREVELLADESSRMLHQAIAAYHEGNADMARATMGMADQVERTFDTVFEELVSTNDQRQIKDLFAMFVIFSLLERVSDQAKNLCEETVFAATGQTKAPKIYQILFLDEDNSCQSQMAEAIARKAFPNSGHYHSGGRQPAEAVDPQMARFLEEHGIDIAGAGPKLLELVPQELAANHVIVSLEGSVRSYIDEVPFHTVALEWDAGPAPKGLDETQTRQRFEEMYREISLQIRDLMEVLRGEEAL